MTDADGAALSGAGAGLPVAHRPAAAALEPATLDVMVDDAERAGKLTPAQASAIYLADAVFVARRSRVSSCGDDLGEGARTSRPSQSPRKRPIRDRLDG
jgi:hypothetical protein